MQTGAEIKGRGWRGSSGAPPVVLEKKGECLLNALEKNEFSMLFQMNCFVKFSHLKHRNFFAT